MLVSPISIYFLTFTLFVLKNYVNMSLHVDLGYVWTSGGACFGFGDKVDLSALWSYLVKLLFRIFPVKFLGITSTVFA